MPIESIFLVLSDLHFGRDFHLPPELPPLEIMRMAKWFGKGKELTDFVEHNCGGHSFECVGMLPYYVNSLLRDVRENEGYVDEEHDDSFDLCVLLGDQATVPDPQSYTFLWQYLTQTRYTTAFEIGCRGLGLAKDKILAVPGNHDKLLRSNLDIYHQAFTEKLGVPRVDPGKCVLVHRRIWQHEFLFLLIDPSVYAPKNEELIFDLRCRDHLACGRVTPELSKEIKQKLNAIRQGDHVDGVKLPCRYDDAIKVLLVHYAVDGSQLKGRPTWGETLLPHECIGLDKLVADLKTDFKFSLALHGHLHVPGLYRYHGVHVAAATTTSEKKGPNGFFVLKLLDTGEIRAEHHRWTGKTFAPDPEPSLNRPLEVYAKRGIA